MVGHGRSRGRGTSLDKLGVEKGETLPERVLEPPETFPALQFKPVQNVQEKNLADSYLLVIKKEFQEHMQNSQYHIQPSALQPDIERYSDQFQILANKGKSLILPWSRFPKELRPSAKSVKRKKPLQIKPNVKKIKRDSNVNVSKTLDALEKKEGNESGDNDEEKETEGGKENNEITEEDEDDVDEELDEGTDYLNSYFDNGESYLDDEDDALEEGGIF